jgi:hypothetical protein
MSARRSTRRKTSKSSRKTVHERSHLVLEDMLRNQSLSLTKAAHKRRVDPRTVVAHFPTRFRKDSSGRIKARAVTGKLKILYIPGFEPGEVIPVPTQSEKERLLLGRWMAAVNAAGRGDFSKIDRFPKNKRIGGVLLPTKRAEVQQILVSLADRESPFEGLYRTIVRRS